VIEDGGQEYAPSRRVGQKTGSNGRNLRDVLCRVSEYNTWELSEELERPKKNTKEKI
jgi:hypothetical protein